MSHLIVYEALVYIIAFNPHNAREGMLLVIIKVSCEFGGRNWEDHGFC